MEGVDPGEPSVAAEASLEYLSRAERLRIASRIVVPGVMSPEEPCQVIVQPSLRLPMSSALDSAT